MPQSDPDKLRQIGVDLMSPEPSSGSTSSTRNRAPVAMTRKNNSSVRFEDSGSPWPTSRKIWKCGLSEGCLHSRYSLINLNLLGLAWFASCFTKFPNKPMIPQAWKWRSNFPWEEAAVKQSTYRRKLASLDCGPHAWLVVPEPESANFHCRPKHGTSASAVWTGCAT
ncbi:hypothetical protein BJX68DRAFT_223633 [Aspergillus pseudodeflectus]|uniref:Uncharacterized protein n=1 Tax=Aspergillus pseudodeflectus TaxID=176178 RepID=A0ABR4LC27_9EURO